MYKTILRGLMGGTNCPNFGNSDVKLLTTVMEYTIITRYSSCTLSGQYPVMFLSLGIKKGTFADDFRVIKD